MHPTETPDMKNRRKGVTNVTPDCPQTLGAYYSEDYPLIESKQSLQ